MNITKICVLASFIAVTGCSDGLFQNTHKASKSECKIIENKIDDIIKEYAMNAADGEFNDKSAMQQTARYVSNGNRILSIQSNLEIMSQNGCDPRKIPISPDGYLLDAAKCYGSTLKLRYSSGKDVNKSQLEVDNLCDYKKWKIR